MSDLIIGVLVLKESGWGLLKTCVTCAKQYIFTKIMRKGLKHNQGVSKKFCSTGCRKMKIKKSRGPTKVIAKKPSEEHRLVLWQKTNEFMKTKAWLKLRYQVFKRDGKICALCGSSKAPLHVDHIKSRFWYPKLYNDLNNLQVLCHDCNVGKGCVDSTDWRKKEITPLQPTVILK